MNQKNQRVKKRKKKKKKKKEKKDLEIKINLKIIEIIMMDLEKIIENIKEVEMENFMRGELEEK